MLAGTRASMATVAGRRRVAQYPPGAPPTFRIDRQHHCFVLCSWYSIFQLRTEFRRRSSLTTGGEHRTARLVGLVGGHALCRASTVGGADEACIKSRDRR